MREKNDLKLAVLIDADNIPYANIGAMLDEIAKFGIPAIKRIYGDWTTPTVGGWKPALLEHAITPIQQYSYTKGKNATDSAMIIDAMDILHSEKLDGFCLVSSDSDFTRLAIRLRESGKFVIGIGEKKTPKPFIVACDKFIYIEILSDKDTKSATASTSSGKRSKRKSSNLDTISKDLIKLLEDTIDDVTEEDEWAFLGDVGGLLIKKKPDFDPRNYGFTKLTPLVKSLNKYFDIDERKVGNTHIRHVFIKNK